MSQIYHQPLLDSKDELLARTQALEEQNERLTKAVEEQNQNCSNLSSCCWCYIYWIIGINLVGLLLGVIFYFAS